MTLAMTLATVVTLALALGSRSQLGEHGDGVLRGLLLAAVAAQAHEAVAHHDVDGVAHSTELLAGDRASRQGVALALFGDDGLVELRDDAGRVLGEVTLATTAAQAHKTVLVDHVDRLTHVAAQCIARDRTGRERVVRHLLRDHFLVHGRDVLRGTLLEARRCLLAREAELASFVIQDHLLALAVSVVVTTQSYKPAPLPPDTLILKAPKPTICSLAVDNGLFTQKLFTPLLSIFAFLPKKSGFHLTQFWADARF